MNEYAKYANLTAAQKDEIVDGKNMADLNQRLQQLTSENTRSPLKRTHTGDGTSPEATGTDRQQSGEVENGFSVAGADGKHRSKTQRTNGNFSNARYSEGQGVTRSLTFVNTTRTRDGGEQRRTDNIGTRNDQNPPPLTARAESIRISNQSIKYATMMHLNPIIIECNPKLRFGTSEEKKTSEGLVVAFFKEIGEAFRVVYPSHSGTIGFDNWWIDRDGRLVATTNDTDLYIYLAHVDHYPAAINGIQLSPQLPKRLPPGHALIVKAVHDYISVDEVREELVKRNTSTIYSIDEMNGTWNGHSRHIRVDIVDKTERSKLLNGGILSIMGNILNVDEYLPAPKLLICSKCNNPGHMKKECSARFDVCRRCGCDRSDGNDHTACKVMCHHCDGDHISTDFRCPVISNYRRELVCELKRHPERLPAHIQLFLPGKYRPLGSNKTFSNVQETSARTTYRMDLNKGWPALSTAARPQSPTQICAEKMSEAVDAFRNELTTMKTKYEAEQSDIKRRYEEQMKTMHAGWLAIQTQIQTQSEIIQAAVLAVNDVLFPTCDTLFTAMSTIIEEMKATSNSEQHPSCNKVLATVSVLQQQTRDNRMALASHTVNLNNLLIKQKATFCSVVDSMFSHSNV